MKIIVGVRMLKGMDSKVHIHFSEGLLFIANHLLVDNV